MSRSLVVVVLATALIVSACDEPTQPVIGPTPEGLVIGWGTWLVSVNARPLEECGEDPDSLPPSYQMDRYLDDLCSRESDADGFFLDRCGAEDEVRCRFSGTDFECDPFEYSTQLEDEVTVETRITLRGTVESRDRFIFTQEHEVSCTGENCHELPELPCTNIYSGWADCCD